MPESIGPHLLGRVPAPPDSRDFQLADFLVLDDTLDSALLVLQKSHAAASTKAWATIATARIHALEGVTPAPTPDPTPDPTPAPTPPPAPTPTGDVIWTDADTVLDQGNTGHCVGFGWAGWGDTLPVDDQYVDSDGHAIYYEAKVIDGEPGAEDGSNTRSGAKAMQNRKRLAVYAFATSTDDITTWLRTKGPVVFGIDWYNDMFNPNADGVIKPTGGVAGGHEILGCGVTSDDKYYWLQNSWGSSWGLKGRCKIAVTDMAKLLAAQGDCCAAVELPV